MWETLSHLFICKDTILIAILVTIYTQILVSLLFGINMHAMENVLYIALIVLTAITTWAFLAKSKWQRAYHDSKKECESSLERISSLENRIEESLIRNQEVERELAVSNSHREQLKGQIIELTEKLNTTSKELLTAVQQCAALSSELKGSEERFQQEQERNRKSEEQIRESEDILRQQFKLLANDILNEQTKSFKQENREQVEGLLKPFRDNITEFRERVEKIYSIEAEQHGALKNELGHLLELNRKITSETKALTKALKGDSKIQGDYGEMILDTILSASNLVKGVHYTVQQTLKGDEGENLRPDVILHLPDKKQIVIDSKTSLTAYSEYINAEDYDSQQMALKAHIESVRKHVLELSRKSYQELMSTSPDFVIMFIPNEPAFLVAQQAAPELWGEAYKKKVIISSPSNIFALLKLVDNLWQRSDLERNTRDIAECGSRMYDQLVSIIEALGDLERALNLAQKSYNETLKRMTSGNNNMVRLGAHMQKLNIKIKKTLPQSIVDMADLNLEIEESTSDNEKDRE